MYALVNSTLSSMTMSNVTAPSGGIILILILMLMLMLNTLHSAFRTDSDALTWTSHHIMLYMHVHMYDGFVVGTPQVQVQVQVQVRQVPTTCPSKWSRMADLRGNA
jgi:hypothetical protein